MTTMRGLKMGPAFTAGLLCLFLQVLQVLPTAGCPQQCQCRDELNGIVVECIGQDFYQVPEGFPADTVEIDLSYNDIPALVSSTFPRLTKMTKLVMDSCNIKRLENYALIAFPQLQNVTLTNNVIDTMGPDALSKLPNLKYVHLDNNHLKTIPSLDGLNLVDLHLAGNSFSQITNISFHGASIINLNLNNNDFSQLNPADLAPLKDSLKSFQLSHNRKPLTIDPDAFQGFYLDSLSLRNSFLRDSSFLKHVRTTVLDISGNAFDSLDFSSYTNLESVEVLYAQDIFIDMLEQATLWPFVGLKYLNLANTSLLMCKGEDFNHMTKLQTLVLEDNPFIMLPTDLGSNLPSLRELHLARCHVMTLDPAVFKDMTNLTSLDVQRNKVQVFPEAMKPTLQRLTFFGLEGNPLHCNCEMLWFWEWQQSIPNNTANCSCSSPHKIPLLEASADDFKCSEPSFIKPQTEITTLVGKDVYLTCLAKGDPPPEVEWEAPAGETLRITPSYNRTMYKTYAIWRLKRVELKRAGLYKCVARNLLGTVTANTQLYVVTSLDSTQVPSNVTDNTTTAVTTSTPSTTITTSTTETPTTVPTSSPSTEETVSTVTQNNLTLPSYNVSFSNTSLTNFSVVFDTSESPEGALNLTADTSTDSEGVNNTKDNSLLVKIIIIVSCAVGLILLIVCIIVIVRQRQHSQRYDVSTTSFDNSNREHLTNGLNHKPVAPTKDIGDEKQKLTEV